MQTESPAPTCANLNGVLLVCPKCASTEACINVHLGDLGDAGTDAFDCRDCGETFGVDDVRELLAKARRWTAVLAWLESVPQFEE